MSKKVIIDGPVGTKRQSDNTEQPESGSLVALNFKVTPEIKKEFKVWAASHGKTQRQVLEEAFDLLRESYQEK